MSARANGIAWAAYALLLFGAPLVFTGSGLAQTLITQTAIAAIACLSYHLLFGEGGMVSFGHAVHVGLGGYAAMHLLRAMAGGGLALPVSLLPLAGGLAGAACAALFGLLATRRSGTVFAMITLGLGELVAALSLMLPEVFGGEGGLSGNRVIGAPVLGISFGPQREVSLLAAAYCLGCSALMYGFTRTPLGRLLNAARDNAQRLEFLGYSAQQVRWRAFVVAGFFAGIAGGLGALHFEIVTPQVLGAGRSGAYLLFVFLGGTGYFFGPILGALLMVLSLLLLSELTRAWLLYLGLAFLLAVMRAPGGLAGVLVAHGRVLRSGAARRRLPAYAALAGSGALALLGFAALVEMLYHRQLEATLGTQLRFFGVGLRADAPLHWAAAAALLALGLALWRPARRCFARQLAGEAAR